MKRFRFSDRVLDSVGNYRVYSGHMKGLTISQLAHQAGINRESLRFYESQDLIPEPPRSQAGYRMYPPGIVYRVRFIKRAQELGFSLREIKELLALAENRTADCAEVRDLARTKVAEISQKIQMLEAMRQALNMLSETCPGSGPVAACSILESFCAGEEADELANGFAQSRRHSGGQTRT